MARYKVIDVVGARPQFIKVAAFAEAARASAKDIDYLIVNTDQHYDVAMNERFFEEYRIPKPRHSLGVGSGSHAEQTARMMTALEKIFLEEKPDLVQVYGDTNSTVAAALVAAKLHIPVSHVEAGMRSFNRRMPEEINRVVTDHVSSLLFVPTPEALKLLKKEGIVRDCHWIGDVMLDVVRMRLQAWKQPGARRPAPIEGPYAFATIHRAENTDSRERLVAILEGLRASEARIYLSVHPRLKKVLAGLGLDFPSNVTTVDPLSHDDTLNAIHHSSAVITDSGGLQKEAFYLGRPCVTLRDETEWTELVKSKVNVITGADSVRIAREIRKAMARRQVRCPKLLEHYGSGKAARRALKHLVAFLRKKPRA